MNIKRPAFGAAVIAGVTAGVGYLVQQEIDNRLTGRNLDDLLLLGRPFAKSGIRGKTLGTLIHFGNAAGIGIVYAVAANDRLPGPAWARNAFPHDGELLPLSSHGARQASSRGQVG